MATITRTKTFTDGQDIDREDIADLLEEALVSAIGYSDLAADAQLVTAQSEAPTPNAGKWWWDMTDKLMKAWNSTYSLWLAFGPDRYDVPVQNWYGATMNKGWPCTLVAGGGSYRVTGRGGVEADKSTTFVGLMQETTASGMWGPMAIMGVMWGQLEASPDGGKVPAAGYVRHGAGAGNAYVGYPAPGSPSSRAFGVAIAEAGPLQAFKLAWFAPTQGSNTT